MKRLCVWLLALTVLTCAASAQEKQDFVGTWQGTLEAGKSLRIVMKVEKPPSGELKTMVYSIDQPGRGLAASATTVQGSAVKVALTVNDAIFEGKFSADGKFITGTWTQGGGKALPLTLARATAETAWAIPDPPAPPKMMAADANPSFEVATIKPNDSGANGMQQLTFNGHQFVTRASSLIDLISFSYQVQAKQIVNAPDWASQLRFDVEAVPDTEGNPTPDQMRMMIRKMLTERFKLTFHKEKREFSAFVLTTGKGPQKPTPTQVNGPGPGFGMRPAPGGLMIIARNGTMSEFTDFLQNIVLDRPVVDQTGLSGHYDLNITFTPDDTQFNGHPPPIPAATDNTPTAPSFAEAVQQVGLKIEARKAPVDVVVVDHVERYSAN